METGTQVFVSELGVETGTQVFVSARSGDRDAMKEPEIAACTMPTSFVNVMQMKCH
jgi:hypothetical protein